MGAVSKTARCMEVKGHELMLKRAAMRVIRWMCGTCLREKKIRSELRDRIVMEAIGSVLKRSRLKWFCDVEKKDKED